MPVLILSAMAFLFTHLGISSTPVRGMLVRQLGEGLYLGLYSLMAFVTLGFLIVSYAAVPHTEFLWYPNAVAYGIAKVLMLLAFILLATGLMSRNPTAVGQEKAASSEPAGIVRITRHPVQWSFLLWSIAHILANPDAATIVLAGTIGLLAAVGMAAIDAKRKSRDEPEWEQFYRSTSAIPFLAVMQGRTSLSWRELGWTGILAGVVLYVVVYLFHGWIAGVPLL